MSTFLKVISIYVEGESDIASIRVLLENLIEKKGEKGISIEFKTPLPGKNKDSFFQQPFFREIIQFLERNTSNHILVMPDLYPSSPFGCPNPSDLKTKLRDLFAKNNGNSQLQKRFEVFCLKHELEALLLASKEHLRNYLGHNQFDKACHGISINWNNPEDQNHNHPPKKIIVSLFDKAGKKYTEVIDAPQILGKTNYKELSKACPEFKLFVDFLENS